MNIITCFEADTVILARGKYRCVCLKTSEYRLAIHGKIKLN